jgi:hypothetical protein
MSVRAIASGPGPTPCAGVEAGEGEGEARVLDLVGERRLGREHQARRGGDGEQLQHELGEGGDRGVLELADAGPVGGQLGGELGRSG